VDTHEPLAISNLFDNLYIEDALQVGNRQSTSNGVGQTGTENVFWATRGTGTAYSFNVMNGYVIGTDPELTVVTKQNLFFQILQQLAELFGLRRSFPTKTNGKFTRCQLGFDAGSIQLLKVLNQEIE